VTTTASSPTPSAAIPPRPVATASRPVATSPHPAAHYQRRIRAFRDAVYSLGPSFMLRSPTRAECMRALGSVPRFAWIRDELASIERAEGVASWALKMQLRLAGGGSGVDPREAARRSHDDAQIDMADRLARHPLGARCIVVDAESATLRLELAAVGRALALRAAHADLDEALARGGRAGVVATRLALARVRAALRSRTA